MVAMKSIVSILFLSILALFILSGYAYCNYSGPETIIENSWGKGSEQFGIELQDTSDNFPVDIKVNMNGFIVIADIVNKRIKLYTAEGLLKTIIKPYKAGNIRFGWPAFLNVDANCNVYSSNYDKKLQKYGSNGKLIWEKDVYVDSIDILNNNTVLVSGCRNNMKGKEKYVKFNTDGTLAEVFAKRPKEIGQFIIQKSKLNRYNISIEFPKISYQISLNQYKPEDMLVRDRLYNLYVVQRNVDVLRSESGESFPTQYYDVVRLDNCTRYEFTKDFPKTSFRKNIVVGSASKKSIEFEEYGQPEIAPSGDIYCWTRTKDEYKILKWTWQGEPDAPQSLTAKSLELNELLNWEPPVRNSENIEGYEIVRSTEVCGPFKPIERVAKDVLQFEDKSVEKDTSYYYQVRAIKKGGYSGYSNKAVGRQK